jgi:hypothetical protein
MQNCLEMTDFHTVSDIRPVCCFVIVNMTYSLYFHLTVASDTFEQAAFLYWLLLQ